MGPGSAGGDMAADGRNVEYMTVGGVIGWEWSRMTHLTCMETEA